MLMVGLTRLEKRLARRDLVLKGRANGFIKPLVVFAVVPSAMFLVAHHIPLASIAVLVGFADLNLEGGMTCATSIGQWCWLTHNKLPVKKIAKLQ